MHCQTSLQPLPIYKEQFLDDEDLCLPIFEEEIQGAITQLRVGKALGADGISS